MACATVLCRKRAHVTTAIAETTTTYLGQFLHQRTCLVRTTFWEVCACYKMHSPTDESLASFPHVVKHASCPYFKAQGVVSMLFALSSKGWYSELFFSNLELADR
eukprot:3505968-Amphidinium_carterae.1